eukprot:61875-Karenia_brevis.AAC.1
MSRAAPPTLVPQSTLSVLGLVYDCTEAPTVPYTWRVCMSLKALDIQGQVHHRKDQPGLAAKQRHVEALM